MLSNVWKKYIVYNIRCLIGVLVGFVFVCLLNNYIFLLSIERFKALHGNACKIRNSKPSGWMYNMWTNSDATILFYTNYFLVTRSLQSIRYIPSMIICNVQGISLCLPYEQITTSLVASWSPLHEELVSNPFPVLPATRWNVDSLLFIRTPPPPSTFQSQIPFDYSWSPRHWVCPLFSHTRKVALFAGSTPAFNG